MSAQHTPGRLVVQHPYAGERGWEIAFEPGLEQICQNVTEANARRLAACWNRLEKFTTAQIEDAGYDLFADVHPDFERAMRQRDAQLMRNRLDMVGKALDEWQEKTDWVQATVRTHELGMHRADVLRARIETLEAQRDELLDALRPLITKRMGAEQIREGIQRAIAKTTGEQA